MLRRAAPWTLLLLTACESLRPAAPACLAPEVIEDVKFQVVTSWLVAHMAAFEAGDTDFPEPDAATVTDVQEVPASRSDGMYLRSVRACRAMAAARGDAPRPMVWATMALPRSPRWPWEVAREVGPLVVVCDATRKATSLACAPTFVSDEAWKTVWPDLTRPAVQQDGL